MKYLIVIFSCVVLLAACDIQELPKFEDLPVGDAERGAELYNQRVNDAPSCEACHNVTEQRKTGPGLGGYAAIAATRVEGLSAAEYTFDSIVNPDAVRLSGYSGSMYGFYASKLSLQDIADIMAYVLTLE